MEGDFRRKVGSLFVLLLLTTSLAFGQGISTGSISGVVQDQQQAVIAGAKVSAKNADTGIETATESNSAGLFALRQLPVGTYTVTIEASGFSKLRIANVAVSSGRDNDLGIRALAVGKTEEVVNVEGAAPLVETTTQAVTTSFDTKRITSLPMGVNSDSLVLFVPGVASGGSVGFSNTNGADLAVNGQRARSNNFQIDGQYNNDNSIGGPGIFLENQDLLGELQVSNNYSAEYGRNAGSVINYVTKSGTNAFHGTASYTWRGSTFDSLNKDEKSPLFTGVNGNLHCSPGANPDPDGVPGSGDECDLAVVPRYVQNLWGFTFGGPVLKDKLWFFASGFWDRIRTGGSPTSSSPQVTVTPAGIATLQATYPGNPGVAMLANVSAAVWPFITPQITSVGTQTVTDGVTPVDIDMGTVTYFPSSVSNLAQWSGRVDYQLGSKDRFFFRYIRDDEITTNVDFGGGIQGVFADVPSLGKQYGADWVRTWSPTVVNQLRFGKVFLDVGFEDGTVGCNRAALTSCIVNVAFNDGTLGFGPATNFPQGRKVQNYQVQDNATWVTGRHTFKFGGEYDNQNSPSDFLPGVNGQYVFDSYDALLQDAATSFFLVDGPLGFPFKEQDVSLYFQDDWRIKDNLTLNLGLRWEFNQQSVNLLHNEAVARQAGSSPFWDTSLPESAIAPPLVPNDLNNFSPVIGFAWTPRIFESIFGKDKTVIRGGYRISYDPAFYNIHLNVATSAPTVNSVTLSIPNGDTIPGVPTTGFTGDDVRAIGLAFLPVGLDPGYRAQTTISPNLHNPYTQQWSLGIQREIGSKMALEVRYLGNHTVGQFQGINANPSLRLLIANGFDGSNPNRQDVIPSGFLPCLDNGPNGIFEPTTNGLNPAFGDDAPGRFNQHVDCTHRNVTSRINGAFGIYHSLQSRFDIRSWHGVTSTLSYTWSHAIDNASEIFAATQAGLIQLAQNPFDINRGERGSSNFDYRHILGLQFIYELPWYKNQQGILGRTLGGWQFSTAYRYTTGQPWGVIQSKSAAIGSPQPGLCDPSNRFSTTTDTCRPILLDPLAPFNAVASCLNATCTSVRDERDNSLTTSLDGFHWLVNNLNSAIFFGTPFAGIGRNPFTGQTVNNASMSLYKTTKINERFNLQLQLTIFNVFNRAYYGVPATNIRFADGTAGFCGVPTDTQGGCGFGNTDFKINGNDGFDSNATQNGIGRRRLSIGAKLVF